ncbi:hypothetical protein BZZ01_01625 [Nostocales cyanobacterium HT-58-2]|nr:hypothetical protein BZZ01_01625 [Nostocales cyanobacterium HT-58-2]
MTSIEKSDLVGLTRNVNHDLPKGLVGMVLECDKDIFDVQFPFPGKSLYAKVPREDIKFLVGMKQLAN